VNTALDAYFASMRSLLRGDSRPRDLAPWGQEDGLALYAWMVEVDRTGLLADQFPELRAACNATAPESFRTLARAYLRAYPPTHWDTVEIGRELETFLAEDPSYPACFRELADLAWTRRAAALSPRPLGEVVLNETIFVRLYTHDVLACLGIDAVALPPQRPTAVILGRSRKEGRPLVVRADAARLQVLATSVGGVSPVPWISNDDALTRARHSLEALDLIAPSHPLPGAPS
jgi:hypothetical protein